MEWCKLLSIMVIGHVVALVANWMFVRLAIRDKKREYIWRVIVFVVLVGLCSIFILI